jgi:inner membrane protein
MVIVGLIYKNNSLGRSRWMNATLIYSIAYFGMTFVNKAIVDKHFRQSIKVNQFESKNYMSNPTILNNFLWYSLINTDSTLLVGEYSLLQHSDEIKWRSYPINKQLLLAHPSPDAKMLEWFSQGFYISQQNKDTLEVFIPKFGRGDLDKSAAKETFLFYYQIYFANGQWQFKAHQPDSQEMNYSEALKQLIRHIKGT